MKPEIIPTSNTIQGLPLEGKLLVMRSDGTVENDWSVAQSFEGTTKDGTPVQFVEVTKPSEDGGLLSKTVPADTLLSWQVPENAERNLGDMQLESYIGHQATSTSVLALESSSISDVSDGSEHSSLVRSGSPEEHRRTKIFAPIVTVEEFRASHPSTQTYDHLFGAEHEYEMGLNELQQQSLQRSEAERDYVEVTGEMRKNAEVCLDDARRADRNIDRILTAWQQEHSSSELPLPDAIRSDSALRYRLGSYFMNQKLPERMSSMPDRIVMNGKKSSHLPHYRGLGDMSSQEYTSLLALSMIDGTYRRPAEGDVIDMKSDGSVIVGQHRAAAKILLS